MQNQFPSFWDGPKKLARQFVSAARHTQVREVGMLKRGIREEAPTIRHATDSDTAQGRPLDNVQGGATARRPNAGQ